MRRLFILTVVALAVAAGAPAAASADTGQHSFITITSNQDFTTCGCVTSGSGSPGDPFVIGPWAINAPGGGTSSDLRQYAIKVDNSLGGITESFRISGISANYSGDQPPDMVIWLQNVTGTTISNVSANEDGIGVELDNSSNITLDRLSFNKMNGTGLRIDGSSYVYLSNSKFKSTADTADETMHDADGVYATNSSYLHLGGVAACPASQICNSFDYDSGFGVYLQNTTNSFIDHASANADDTAGYVLDNSSGVMLSNSGAGSDGPICFSLGGPMNKTHTGYESDLQANLMLIKGSSGNTFSNDQFAAPIGGPSIASGGNGFFFDPCSGSRITFPVPPALPEAGMGSDNTFPGTCYSSNDIGLPSAPCK